MTDERSFAASRRAEHARDMELWSEAGALYEMLLKDYPDSERRPYFHLGLVDAATADKDAAGSGRRGSQGVGLGLGRPKRLACGWIESVNPSPALGIRVNTRTDKSSRGIDKAINQGRPEHLALGWREPQLLTTGRIQG